MLRPKHVRQVLISVEMKSINSIDNYCAIANRIVKLLSKLSDTKWKIVVVSQNPLKFTIVDSHDQILFIPIKNSTTNEIDVGDGFYKSYEEFINRLVNDPFPLNLCIGATGLDFIFNKRFGNTIEEINIHLDMLNV